MSAPAGRVRVLGRLLFVVVALLRSSQSAEITASPLNLTVPDYVTRHAPIVRLHSEDPFRPSDLLTHVRHTTPMIGFQLIPGIPDLNLDNLALLNSINGTSSGHFEGKRKNEVCLTANEDPTTLPMPIFFLGETPDASGKLHNATACVVVLVEKSMHELDAFFFYFYSYDRGANISQVVEPLDRLIEGSTRGLHFGDHVGDWEHNMVRFRYGKPTGIWYSQHSDGRAYDWNDPELSKENERPIVYSAYGSHANYATPGSHIHDTALIDYCDTGPKWDPLQSAYFYHLTPTSATSTGSDSASASSHPDPPISPADYPITPLIYPPSNAKAPYPTSFFRYTGRWGDEQYPDTDLRQKTTPYFGLKRFETGPTGPWAKQLVRKEVFPDRRHVKSWVEWGVAMFMAWYPCCLRGWRKWVLLGLVVLGLVVITGLVVWLIILCKVKRAERGYKRVEREIPLDDLDRYD